MEDYPPAAAGRRRLYCPVVGCPEGSCARAQGWTDPASLRKHLDGHAAGRFLGDVPASWLAEHGMSICTVCSRILAIRYGGTCPRCRPSLSAEGGIPVRGQRDVPTEWPTFRSVFVDPHRVRAKVPGGAKAIWAECFTHALKHVAYYNDEKAWVQLPKMVLGASSATGGAEKKKCGPTREVTERCRRWLDVGAGCPLAKAAQAW